MTPQLALTGATATMVVAVFGTTISPYLLFWQASEEVEDDEADPTTDPLIDHPDQAPAQLSRIRWDTLIGMGFANSVAFFIILTTAVTLHAAGMTDIQTSADAAAALRPIAGDLAFALFSLGIIGTGLLAVPVLAGSAAYAICESRGWKIGLEHKPREAVGFYTVIGLATLVGLAVDYSPLDPIRRLVLERRPQWRYFGAADGGDDDRGLPQRRNGRVRRPASAARAGMVRNRLHGHRSDHDVSLALRPHTKCHRRPAIRRARQVSCWPVEDMR